MEEPTEIHRNLMPEKRQERKTWCGTNASICGTLERTGKGCPFPKTCFWIYHLHGVTDASLDLCNVQPNAKVLTDGTGCNGSAPGGKGEKWVLAMSTWKVASPLWACLSFWNWNNNKHSCRLWDVVMVQGKKYGTTLTKLWGLLSGLVLTANLHVQNPGAITKAWPSLWLN